MLGHTVSLIWVMIRVHRTLNSRCSPMCIVQTRINEVRTYSKIKLSSAGVQGRGRNVPVRTLMYPDYDSKLWAIKTLLNMDCNLGWKRSLSSVSWVRFPCLLERLSLEFFILWFSSPIWNNFELSTVFTSFHFRWLEIKGIYTAFLISIMLFFNHLKWNSS